MSAKQDKVYPRNAAALDQQYNFGKSFQEVMGVAINAQDTAKTAQKTANQAKEAYEGLDQEQIFKLLTNNEEDQGVYRGENGKVYINADFIKSGIIAAALIDVKNLIAEKLSSVFGKSELHIDGAALRFLSDGKETANIYNYTEENGTQPLFELQKHDNKENTLNVCELYADCLRFLFFDNDAEIYQTVFELDFSTGKPILKLLSDGDGKELFWKENYDNTYSLAGM